MEKEIISEIYIGVNGSGKTKKILTDYAKEIKKANSEKFIFIPSEQLYEKEFKKESSTTGGNFAYKLIQLIQLVFVEITKQKLDFSTPELAPILLSSLPNREQNVEELNSFFEEKFGDDSFFCLKRNDIIKNNLMLDTISLNLDFYETPSGLNNYSLIKMLFEILEYAFEKNISTENLNLDEYIIIIDEPEKFCHPNLIRKIGRILRKLNNKINMKLITHSPIIVNEFINVENTKIIKMADDEIIFEVTFNEILELPKLNGNNTIISKILSNKITRLEFIEALFMNKLVLIEGMIEKSLLQQVIENDDNYDIFPFSVCGKENMYLFAQIFEKLKYNSKNIFCIFDRDENIKNDGTPKSETKIINNQNINKKLLDKSKDMHIYSFKNTIEDSFQEELININVSKDRKNKYTHSWFYENLDDIIKTNIFKEICSFLND